MREIRDFSSDMHLVEAADMRSGVGRDPRDMKVGVARTTQQGSCGPPRTRHDI
jgi:hypothetical protein